MEVGKPEVILKTIDGKVYEPFNEMIIITPEEYVGTVTAELGKRKGEMLDMTTDDKTGTRMTYKISERNGLGLRNALVSATKGTVSINTLFRLP
jgi:GTP-binding protein